LKYGPSTSDESSPIKMMDTNQIKQIVGGAGFTIFLTVNGEVYSFGNNTIGCLGVGDIKPRRVPARVGTSSTVQQIASYSEHSIYVESGGNAFSFGRNFVKFSY
jgi:alpha-tubulin suppressor-like RCC1 family protein